MKNERDDIFVLLCSIATSLFETWRHESEQRSECASLKDRRFVAELRGDEGGVVGRFFQLVLCLRGGELRGDVDRPGHCTNQFGCAREELASSLVQEKLRRRAKSIKGRKITAGESDSVSFLTRAECG